MRKFLTLLVMFLTTGLLMAQGHDDAAAQVASQPFFTGPIAMALGAGLCGLAQGKAVSSACEGIARNPAAANIRTTLIIGLALIESLALYTLLSLFL